MKYTLQRSRRKTVSISVGRSCEVIVKAPLKAPKAYIDGLVEKNRAWIEKMQARHQSNARQGRPLTEEEISALKKRAEEVMTRKTHYYEQLMGVRATGIKITSAKGRWGSCSYKNSICYSYRTQLLPDRRQDYIAVHELAHIIHKNHSPAFYKEIEKILPDYKQIIKSVKSFSNFDLY